MDIGSDRPLEALDEALTDKEGEGVGDRSSVAGSSDGSRGSLVDEMPGPGDLAPEAAADPEPSQEDRQRRHPLKTKVMNFGRFIDETARGLDAISAMVWFTLFRFENDGIAWASQQTIAERLGVDAKTVYRHIGILKEKKLLRVVKRGRRGGHCNTYQLGILPLEPVAKRPARVNTKPR
jgi:hypothetical protein